MKNISKGAAKARLGSARKYAGILRTGNAQELLALPFDKRTRAMRGLAALSKYCGVYARWKSIKEAYQLKWSESDGGLRLFVELTSSKENFPVMVAWIRDAITRLPEKYAQTLIFATLTGLRASEVITSLKLLREDAAHYRNESNGTIEHYRYPALFLRRTKRAYVSLLTPKILEAGERADVDSYNSLRLVLKRRGMGSNVKYCRRVFATYLRMRGIQSESIDLLQGRIGKSVFLQHYWRPDFEQERSKIRGLLGELAREITA